MAPRSNLWVKTPYETVGRNVRTCPSVTVRHIDNERSIVTTEVEAYAV